MKKQTAVEWVLDWMDKNQYFIGNDLLQAVKQAKEMEKQQIIEACESTSRSVKLDETKQGFFAKTGEGYYKENYEL